MERVMVTIPEDLLREVDSATRQLKRNRSEVVRQALAEWLRQKKQREFDALLEEGYRESASQAREHASLGWLAQSAIVEGDWSWDD